MKIGILTFHRAINYGAVLQCYALFETLRSMGHDVELIDYRPDYIEQSRKLFCNELYLKKNWVALIKHICLMPFTFFMKRRASKVFDTFLQKHFKLSNTIYTVSDKPSGYDAIIFGSDQIWNPRICHGFDPIFWGQFDKGETLFISYAASLEGYQTFTKTEWDKISTFVRSFDYLSVRESDFCKILSNKTKRAVKWVLDPTLLAPSNVLKNLVKKSPSDIPYILLFTVQKGNLPYKVAQLIANNKKYEVIRVRAKARLKINDREENVTHLYSVTPEKFLELIYFAKYVVTNSFHATAISMKFEKEFYSVECCNPKRILSILDATGLQNRYITSSDNFHLCPSIDYSDVKDKLGCLSTHSNDYLVSSLTPTI